MRPAAPLPAAHCSLTSDVQVKPNRGRAAGVMRKAVADPNRRRLYFLYVVLRAERRLHGLAMVFVW